MLALTATLAEPQHFSLLEKLLLATLIAASAAYFGTRFATVLRKILLSKPDPSFHLSPIGRRLWEFFWQVLCQAKVIRERPLPGLAHAFVFWAFCAFALVTLNHCAAVLGLGFLSPAGAFGRFYFYFAAVFALACAAGILGLFLRRFLVRPKWLGEKLSYQSGVIALLIFVLMATYLASFFVADMQPRRPRPLVDSHARPARLSAPHSPHQAPAPAPQPGHGFSLARRLQPDSSARRRRGLRPASPERTSPGWSASRPTPASSAAAAPSIAPPPTPASCSIPKRSSSACAATSTTSAQPPIEPLLGKYNSQEAVFQCTTCGACEFQCPVGIEHLPILVGLRRGAVNTGAWENDYGAKLFLTLERGSNALGRPASERDKFIQKAGLPYLRRLSRVLPLARLHGRLRPQGPRDRRRLARIMNYLGASYGVLRKEKCTGDPSAASATICSSSNWPKRI